MNYGIRALARRTRRFISPLLTIVLALVLSGALVGTILLTSNLEWPAFLGGVLFAGMLALISQTTRMALRLARRDAQIRHYRERLEQEAAGVRAAHAAAAYARAELQLVLDATPYPVLYVDRNLQCRHHNRAALQYIGVDTKRNGGQPIRALLGERAYETADAQFQQALEGKEREYELVVRNAAGRLSRVMARQIPYPTVNPDGFYLLFFDNRDAAAGANAASPDAGPRSGPAQNTVRAVSAPEGTGPGAVERQKLLSALHGNEFFLLAQRIACLKPHLPEADCYEVLLRLKEEEQNLLPPGGFIPVAERYGLMGEIDRWVVHAVVTHCAAQLQQAPDRHVPMLSVNLSLMSIADPDFALFVRSELRRFHVPPRALCFEIDETDLLENTRDVQNFVAAVRPAGCRIAIDGFGRSGMPFELLTDMPVDFLKLDASAVETLARMDTAKMEQVKTTCEKIGASTVAMFVESREMAQALTHVGIDYLQGFGIAMPAPVGDALTSATPEPLPE